MEPGLLRLCIELASDAQSSKAKFFLMVLYHWVAVVARDERFEALMPMYNEWMNVARGIDDPTVKRWRHRALLIFQGIETLVWDRWWEGFANEGRES
jgi:hypothetical protein